MTKRELIDLCLQLPDCYEDYPFGDAWAIMRHKGNKKSFASISIHHGQLMINLKCNPFDAGLLRREFKDIIPGYHMNKDHWNSVFQGGDVPPDMLKLLIEQSYNLTKPKRKTT